MENKNKLKAKGRKALKKKFGVTSGDLFSRRGQIEKFWEIQPFFYDESKIFWIWDNENIKWKKSDETNFLNSIQENLKAETINSKARIELIEGFKQIGRKHMPEPCKNNWVQFLDKIYDLENDSNFEASPSFFVTNPISWKIGKNEDTPTIDNYFKEWVGEDFKENLYEIIAYSISSHQFMQRLFALVGGGSNGKGTFINLLQKFLGEDNYVSSELRAICDSRFETARLYKKLVCIMGEVSYDDLKNTNTIKRLSGEDKISFEFKRKDGFTADNTATCICLTNSLPITPDKSVGFYRRWMIIDFPNQFKQVHRDLIEEIPEEEFENLAKKCLKILKKLYKNPSFKNEGDFDERAKRYEERSNPVIRFVETHCDEEEGNLVSLRAFTNACNTYLKKLHLKVLTANQINKILTNDGFIVGPRKIDGASSRCIINLKLLELLKLPKSKIKSYVELSSKKSSNSSNSSNPSEISGEFDKNQDIFLNLDLKKELEDE